MSNKWTWTEAELKLLSSFINPDGTSPTSYREVFDVFEAAFPNRRTYYAVEKRLKDIKSSLRDKTPEAIERFLAGEHVPNITVEPAVDWDPIPMEERWERAEKVTDRQLDYHKKRHHANVMLASNKPVGLAFISDQHIVADGVTHMRRMREDAELVRDTDGLFAVLGGDGVNNHIKHRSAMVSSGSHPGEEWNLYDHYLGLFSESIAAMVSGNHDDWTKDETDIDMVGKLAQKHKVFYAPDFVLLDIKLGDQTYVVKVRHQYRYNSADNETHSIKKMWAMDEHDFDIGVLCHKHTTAMEPFMKHGVQRWAFRPGSYQYSSTYARRYGYGNTFPSCPTAVIFPDDRRIVGFSDVSEAAGYLEYLRR